ncbi:MAG TPA: hypothetical protein VEC57_17695 [Candidatus Limnocylindrales bacterium]|nr:hypothetical protein [Candidatus Limnocylindrales bacterium]
MPTALFGACMLLANLHGAAVASGPPTLELRAARTVYTLGESVELTLQVSNESTDPIAIRRHTDVRSGMIWPQIADPGQDTFRRYAGPQYGVKDLHLPETSLQPGESFTVPIKILHHIESKHPEELDRFYAFDRPGVYRIRVQVLEMSPSHPLLSDPVEIEMRAPTGENAKVWRLLQSPDYARFLHTGSPGRAPQVAAGVARVLERYPHSLYAVDLETGLERQRSLAGPAARAAEPDVSIAEIEGRDVLVQTAGPVPRASAAGDAQAVIDAVQAWTSAYNSGDAAAVVQQLSRNHPLRARWAQGEGDADRAAAVAEVERSVAASGRISSDVIGVEINGENANARTIFRAERGGGIDGTRIVALVREGTAWRIAEVDS